MHITDFPGLEDMEQVPVSKLPDRLNHLLQQIEEGVIGFVLTQDNEGVCLLLPCYRKEKVERMEVLEIEVDADLLEQAMEIIEPMGLTPEMLFKQFVMWYVAPETREEAIVWLRKSMDELT